MKKATNIFLVLLFTLGLGIFAYPLVSNFYNDNFQTKVIDEYQKEVENRTDDELERMRLEMTDYNKALATGEIPIQDPYGEETPVEVNSSGEPIILDGLDSKYGAMTAVLDIPSIDLSVPVFNGVGDIQLQRGVGVLPGTSLPVGGESTHSVITGHRGLPTAKLFTDLPKVQIGDMFYIDVLGEKLAYEVREIETIEPTDIGALIISPGEDIVTLLTCTPYMINTHRLIVSGYRVPMPADKGAEIMPSAIPLWMQWILDNYCCLFPIILLFLIWVTLLVLLSSINKRLKSVYKLEDKKYEESHKKPDPSKEPPMDVPLEKSADTNDKT